MFITHSARVHIELGKDRQCRLHVDPKCSSPSKVGASTRIEQQREQPASYGRKILREQPFER